MHFKSVLFNLFCCLISQINTEPCKTPKNETGECILLRDCPSLLDALANKTATSIAFVRESICGFITTDSLVCCPRNSSSSINQDKKKLNNTHLLPDRRYCGYQHSDDFLHDTNTSTLITEFPWLASLAFRRTSESEHSYEKKYLCTGSLINPKYILTAAHCIRSRQFVVMEVRLGEYHTGNDTDCVSEQSIEECSEPVRDYAINKIILHPEYSIEQQVNDIALLRLNGSVSYSDYIRPICLPLPGTKFAKPGDILTTSGWGTKNIEGDRATIKKRVLGEVLTNEDCAKTYKNLTSVKIHDNHLCTKIVENSTDFSCYGDSGAPVIFSHRLQWHQEGIVSAGATICGEKPERLTRVRNFMEWIQETIEP